MADLKRNNKLREKSQRIKFMKNAMVDILEGVVRRVCEYLLFDEEWHSLQKARPVKLPVYLEKEDFEFYAKSLTESLKTFCGGFPPDRLEDMFRNHLYNRTHTGAIRGLVLKDLDVETLLHLAARVGVNLYIAGTKSERAQARSRLHAKLATVLNTDPWEGLEIKDHRHVPLVRRAGVAYFIRNDVVYWLVRNHPDAEILQKLQEYCEMYLPLSHLVHFRKLLGASMNALCDVFAHRSHIVAELRQQEAEELPKQ
jgi:hypothetical protein